MNESSQNSRSQIDRDEQPDTPKSDIPDTNADWFALIEPETDESTKYQSESNVVDVATQHAEQVVEHTGIDVNLDQVRYFPTELRENSLNAMKQSLFV